MMSWSVLLRTRNISDKGCTENQNTRFTYNNFYFENRAVYEITWKNILEPGRLQTTVWNMRIACWIPKATKALSGYVTLIAFPLQQWLHECASMLRYTYLAYLVKPYMLRIILDGKPAKASWAFGGLAPALGDTHLEYSQAHFGIFGYIQVAKHPYSTDGTHSCISSKRIAV
jgi:hypothetical protein